MNHDGRQLHAVHELHCRVATALDLKGDNAAAALGKILLCKSVLGIGLKSGIAYGFDSVIGFKELSDLERVCAVALHTESQRGQTVVKQEHGHGRGSGAEISHKLNASLCDVCGFSEILRVNYAVVGLVGSGQLGEAALRPVKVSAVNDAAADDRCVAVHILCGGVSYDVNAVLKGTAENGGRKGVVDNHGNVVTVSQRAVSFHIENGQSGVGNSFTEDHAGVFVHEGFDLLVGHVGGDEADVDADSLERDCEKIDRSTVDGGQADDVLTCAGDVKNRHQACRLTGGGEHSAHTALECGDLFFDCLKRGV